MNILFVCKHNRFRSKVAEAIFKKYNKNKKIKAKSRATKPDYIPVAGTVQKVLKEMGYKKVNRNPKKLEDKDLEWADVIVIVADNVSVKTNKKTIKWKIPDTDQGDYEEILIIMKRIEKRIKNLISMLK